MMFIQLNNCVQSLMKKQFIQPSKQTVKGTTVLTPSEIAARLSMVAHGLSAYLGRPSPSAGLSRNAAQVFATAQVGLDFCPFTNLLVFLISVEFRIQKMFRYLCKGICKKINPFNLSVFVNLLCVTSTVRKYISFSINI